MTAPLLLHDGGLALLALCAGLLLVLSIVAHRLTRARAEVRTLHRRLRRVTTAALVAQGVNEELARTLLRRSEPVTVEAAARLLQERQS